MTQTHFSQCHQLARATAAGLHLCSRSCNFPIIHYSIEVQAQAEQTLPVASRRNNSARYDLERLNCWSCSKEASRKWKGYRSKREILLGESGQKFTPKMTFFTPELHASSHKQIQVHTFTTKSHLYGENHGKVSHLPVAIVKSAHPHLDLAMHPAGIGKSDTCGCKTLHQLVSPKEKSTQQVWELWV